MQALTHNYRIDYNISSNWGRHFKCCWGICYVRYSQHWNSIYRYIICDSACDCRKHWLGFSVYCSSFPLLLSSGVIKLRIYVWLLHTTSQHMSFEVNIVVFNITSSSGTDIRFYADCWSLVIHILNTFLLSIHNALKWLWRMLMFVLCIIYNFVAG